MNCSVSSQILVEPIIQFPRKAEVGKTYLMQIDIRPVMESTDWPYDEEEFAIYCILDTAPLFTRLMYEKCAGET